MQADFLCIPRLLGGAGVLQTAGHDLRSLPSADERTRENQVDGDAGRARAAHLAQPHCLRRSAAAWHRPATTRRVPPPARGGSGKARTVRPSRLYGRPPGNGATLGAGRTHAGARRLRRNKTIGDRVDRGAVTHVARVRRRHLFSSVVTSASSSRQAARLGGTSDACTWRTRFISTCKS